MPSPDDEFDVPSAKMEIGGGWTRWTPGQERNFLWLAWKGFSYQEIGEITKVSTPVAKQQVTRLRKMFAEWHGEDSEALGVEPKRFEQKPNIIGREKELLDAYYERINAPDNSLEGPQNSANDTSLGQWTDPIDQNRQSPSKRQR